MIMMISKFYSKQKILGGGGNDLLCGVGKLGDVGGLHAMGVYWGVMGAPEMGASLGTVLINLKVLCHSLKFSLK